MKARILNEANRIVTPAGNLNGNSFNGPTGVTMGEALELSTDAKRIMEHWSQEIGVISEACKEKGKPLDYMRQVTTAMLMESTTRYLQHQQNMMMNEGATQPMDVGYFKKYAINLLSAVIPNLIAPDIVSMQPMLNRVGEIRFLKILYGSNKGKIKEGDTMMSLFAAGNGEVNYSSDVVDDETLITAGTSGTGTLAWTPVIPGTVQVTVDGQVAKDDGNGAIVGAGITAGTINYVTGAYSITFGAAPTEATITYEYNNMDVPVKAPEVVIKIEAAPIIAKSRKLKAVYAFDAAYDMTRDYGMDINSELITYTAAQIKHEIDGELMNDLLRIAAATAVTWDSVPRNAISVRDHNESFYNTVVEGGNNIFEATRLANGSYIIAGVGVCNVIETLPRFRSAGALRPVGPHLVGYLGSMPVYKNPFYAADTFLIGWKGSGLFDAGYVYAPYMPVMATQLIMDAEFQGQRGFATSYGKKPINANMYCKGTVTNTGTGA